MTTPEITITIVSVPFWREPEPRLLRAIVAAGLALHAAEGGFSISQEVSGLRVVWMPDFEDALYLFDLLARADVDWAVDPQSAAYAAEKPKMRAALDAARGPHASHVVDAEVRR
jgi:hypothetical protein